MGARVDDWRERAVRNEVRSRERNEWIESASNGFLGHRPIEDYRCECSDGSCVSLLALTRREYDAVRADATHFAIALDHENPAIDRVVRRNDRFVVVETFLETHKRLVLRTDPRR